MPARVIAQQDGREKIVFQCDINKCTNKTSHLFITRHYNRDTKEYHTVNRYLYTFQQWQEVLGDPKGKNKRCKPFFISLNTQRSKSKQTQWYKAVFVQCWEHGGDTFVQRRSQSDSPQSEPKISIKSTPPQTPQQMQLPFGYEPPQGNTYDPKYH